MYLDSTGSLAHPTEADVATSILLITILHKGTIPPHIVRTKHITPYLIVHLRWMIGHRLVYCTDMTPPPELG